MRIRTKSVALLVVGFGLSAGASAQSVPMWRLSPEPTLQIGVVEGAPEYQFFNAVSSVRLDDGRIAVLNAGSHELRFYDADGKILEVIGGEGGGPGEFSLPVRLYGLGTDALMVYDRGNARFSVFTLDGTYVRSERAPLERGRFMYDEWLYDRSWIDGPPLGRGRAAVRAAVSRLPAADTEAGYHYVKVSPQGHLWVRNSLRPDAHVAWTVYDLDARPIGRVTTPPRFEIHEIGRDYVLGVGRDPLDVEYVQLFRLTGAPTPSTASIAALRADTSAQQPPSLPADVLSHMRGTMRQLATQQEIFYANGDYTYAADLAQLENWEEPDGLVVRIVEASPRGWAGLVIDAGTGAICGAGYGTSTPVGWSPGSVACGPLPAPTPK